METGEPIKSATVATSVVHAVLSLKEVTFSGNHEIDKDTRGTFDPPEWVSGRVKQWPVCYTRAKNVKLKAKFEVMAPPTSTETVRVKGVAQLGTATLEWTDSVSVSPSATEVSTGELTSSAPLPNDVACYAPATIQWEAEPPGEPAFLAGASENVLYVTLGDPSGTPAYWTLLDISCRAAHGATNAALLVHQAYAPFTSRTLTRVRDGQGLAYWVPDDTNATCTYDLLSRDDGGGQCGSWAEFLIDMYKCHGVQTKKIEIVINYALHRARRAGFLVREWLFIGNGSRPAPWAHLMYTECVPFPVPGQRNPSPPPAFSNHFIVKALGLYFDPSYGSPAVFTQLEWENASIDGLWWGYLCGYPKSAYPTQRLLEFH
jgi:hypothetical protein